MDCYEAIDVMGDAMDGVLSAAGSAGLDEHIEECAPCRNYFEQLSLTRKALTHLEPEPGTISGRSELIARFKREFEQAG